MLTIAVFLISTLAFTSPVSAHFTLGDYTATHPFHVNDYDSHVSGLIGYVWPGSGAGAYMGFPGTIGNDLAPGYMPPYPADSLAATGAPNNWLQLDGAAYAPFGAILTSSTGDLIFAVNATANIKNDMDFSAWWILIPPEFTIATTDSSNIVTTATNNYANIVYYSALGPYDRFAPGWHAVKIIADTTFHFSSIDSCEDKAGNKATGNACDEWYYVRVNGVTAPSIAGKYFFKMKFDPGTGPGEGDKNSAYFMPVENWPVLLAKGEVDPAIITGTLRYGGYNASLYGTQVQEAGKVWAKMKTKLDPYTGAHLSGPLTDAVGYFNATAKGHYEVEGVAPGIYDVYASAAGYPQTIIASSVTVLRGQSLHFDGYLQPGVVIHGDVNSKHQFGVEPWPYTSYVKIELYDGPTGNHVPDPTANLVSWSPLPCVAGGQDRYQGESAVQCGDPRTASQIAFPWHEWTGQQAGFSWDYSLSGDPNPAIAGYPAAIPGGGDNTQMLTTDPMGVGPAQNWFVTAGSTAPFHFEFGVKGEFGAPRDLDGHVPQFFATWVNGLTPGRYYARAWVFRYVQTGLDGSTFQEYSFDVTPQEWAGDVTLPIDLRLSSWVNKTVHFHDLPGTLTVNPISTGASLLVGGLYADNGYFASWNFTDVTANGGTGTQFITWYGFNDTFLGQNYGIPAGTYTPKVWAQGYLQQTFEKVSVTLSGNPTFISDHLYRGVGFNITAYSIDWERPRVNRNWVWPGYEVEIAILDSKGVFVACIANDCNSPHAGLKTSTSQDATTYFVQVAGTGVDTTDTIANDAWFGVEADQSDTFVGGYTGFSGGSPAATGNTADAPSSLLGQVGFVTSTAKTIWKASFYKPTAIDSGQYCFAGWTYGYVQNKQFCVYANKGQIADVKLNLLIGVNVSLDILFKKEGLITGTPNNMSARVRLFDHSGALVGTWMSSEGVYVTGTGTARAADGTAAFPFSGGFNYLPGGVNLLHVLLAGFPPTASFGDPVFTPGAGDFEVDSTGPGLGFPAPWFVNQGILGAPDYTGGWTAEVDFVNWYSNNTGVFDPTDPTTFGFTHYYSPVVGLLQGESYHIIPGTTATSGVSWTEDGALNSLFLGHSMAMNHLGPYEQQGTWSLTNAHLSGETSGQFEVDLAGYVTGSAWAFTWSNEFRPLSWGSVSIASADGKWTFQQYTQDGIYESFLPPGSYSMTISSPGVTSQTMTFAVTAGQGAGVGTGQQVNLEQSNIPVPEFSGIAIAAFSALAASLYVLRRRRK